MTKEPRPRRPPPPPPSHWCECGAQIGQRVSTIARGGRLFTVTDWRDDENWRICYADFPLQALQLHAPSREIYRG